MIFIFTKKLNNVNVLYLLQSIEITSLCWESIVSNWKDWSTKDLMWKVQMEEYFDRCSIFLWLFVKLIQDRDNMNTSIQSDFISTRNRKSYDNKRKRFDRRVPGNSNPCLNDALAQRCYYSPGTLTSCTRNIIYWVSQPPRDLRNSFFKEFNYRLLLFLCWFLFPPLY